jgi:hypothetical protein
MVRVAGRYANVCRMTDGRQDRVLDLDGAACGRHRSDDQRRDVVGAQCDATGGGRRCTAPEQRDASACASAAAREADQLRQESERAGRRRHRGQLTGDPSQFAAEALARRAVAHVLTSVGVRADASVVRLDQLSADHRACGLTGRGGLREREPRADQERFDRADRCPKRARDLGVRQAGQFPHQ